ncbi:solute carrier family 23 member 1-like [Bolinopsis microptera]|uniref:solute carrier family 23 member 1-like n=1 Tax=Bolinopsis microptera TaxID=2820187 RepID=UPI0030795085
MPPEDTNDGQELVQQDYKLIKDSSPMKIDIKNDDQDESENDLEVIRKQLNYPLGKDPNWFLSVLLGFQQYLILFGSTFAIAVILAPSLCVESNVVVKGILLNTMFVMCGLATMVQIFFGTRLPIVQSGSFVYFAVAKGILSKEPCKDVYYVIDEDGNNGTQTWDPNWKLRMTELQGNLMLASLFQMALGAFGLVGLLLKVIGPITITVLISLLGLCLAGEAVKMASLNWGISLLMVVLVTIFSEYLKNVPVPVPTVSFNISKKIKCGVAWLKLFSTLSIMISLTLVWSLCAILTVTDVLPQDDPARIINITSAIDATNWLYFPYPGQFGTPQVSLGGFIGFIAAVIGGMIESLGDYFACAKLAGAPPPPRYALNRGIMMEGVGCFLTGLCGPGVGVTSYSENIAAIGLTKVGSRRVMFCGAVVVLLMGVIGKLGVLFASIPGPIIGGMYLVMFGVVAAVGISNLRFVDMTSSRNIFVLGISLYMGIVIPMWSGQIMDDPEKVKAIKTGNKEFDQLVAVVLSSGMIVGSSISCLLDNTLPGTDKERGITGYRLASEDCTDKELLEKIYREPVMEYFANKLPILRKLPFVPELK